MRVSTVLPVEDWRACSEAARRAEDEGFDNVQSNELRHDPFAPLAFAALATERVQLATSVAIAFPRSPMIVANQTWDLHRHSRGRFVIGLGSQVKAHNERRFSVPWTAPAERMGEYIEALRAIFRCWEFGEKLDYRGKHYSFTLMTPEFTPPGTGLALPPIALAAVGPLMTRTAARLADSVRLHGFATRAYLEQVVMPQIETELGAAGKSRAAFEITGGGFIATGPDEAAVRAAAEKIRYRIGFYGSTPAYRGVLDVHGLSDLGVRLHQMSREGKWHELAAQISDETLDLFTARAPYEGIAEAIEKRFGGITDTVTIDFLPSDTATTRRKVIEAIHRVPHRFQGFRTATAHAG
ncbi:MAG TPA: TIGR03617 family F420-dependent LLM class oxidoreductase [Acetobacteraceae bacterium]|nr:TIGR03617 family F420-dependent LLM class oxidoreductase [Acetobacteraceae bacterium]